MGPVRVLPARWVVEGPLQESGGRWLSCLAWRAGWTPAPWDSEFPGWTWGAASCQDPSLSAPPRALALLRLSSFMDLEVQAPAGPGSPVCPPPPSPACAPHFHHGGRVPATPANHSAPRPYQCAGRGRPHHFPFLPLPLASPGQLRTAIRTPEHRPFVTCGRSHPGSPSAASGAGQVVPWVVMLALVMVVMEMVELLSTGSTAPGPSGPGRSLAAVESCGLPLTQQHPAGPSASTLPVLSSPSPRCHRGWGGQCQVATVGSACLPCRLLGWSPVGVRGYLSSGRGVKETRVLGHCVAHPVSSGVWRVGAALGSLAWPLTSMASWAWDPFGRWGGPSLGPLRPPACWARPFSETPRRGPS